MHVQFPCAETGNRLEVIREKDGPYHFFWGKEVQSGVGRGSPHWFDTSASSHPCPEAPGVRKGREGGAG